MEKKLIVPKTYEVTKNLKEQEAIRKEEQEIQNEYKVSFCPLCKHTYTLSKYDKNMLNKVRVETQLKTIDICLNCGNVFVVFTGDMRKMAKDMTEKMKIREDLEDTTGDVLEDESKNVSN